MNTSKPISCTKLNYVIKDVSDKSETVNEQKRRNRTLQFFAAMSGKYY